MPTGSCSVFKSLDRLSQRDEKTSHLVTYAPHKDRGISFKKLPKDTKSKFSRFFSTLSFFRANCQVRTVHIAFESLWFEVPM